MYLMQRNIKRMSEVNLMQSQSICEKHGRLNKLFFLQMFHMETSLNLGILNLFILGYKNE